MKPHSFLLYALFLTALPVPALADTYYVSPAGNDANPGSQNQPWQTIQHAVDQTLPGDTVLVENGVYHESVIVTQSGTPNAYIVLKSINLWGAKIAIPETGKVDGIKVAADYIEVDGFEIYDPNLTVDDTGNGITVWQNHHVRILNNRIHDMGGGGIQIGIFDHVLIENNITYRNAYYNPLQASGISLYQARAVDDAPGYHVIVRNNRSYDNINLIPSATNPIGTTDGNGIVIDDFRNSQDPNYDVVFPHRTLVENNLTYNNGGKGINIFECDYIDVFNNTAYHNNRDTQSMGTWRGELSLVYSSNTVWRNNIGVAKPGAGILSWNTGILIAGSEASTWENNLTYNGTEGDPSVQFNSTSLDESDLANNLLGQNPLFADAGNNDFSLMAGSPAIDAGSDQIVSFFDIDYRIRPQGAVDLGAFEFDAQIPVELAAFEATASGSEVYLSWSTASEINNAGFFIEASFEGGGFETYAFVEGQGTTATGHRYTHGFDRLPAGSYRFRLRQVDFDGSQAYSDVVRIDLLPASFRLEQSYPNPFNPETRIKYHLPAAHHVRLEIFDPRGQRVAVLVDEPVAAGAHETSFDAGRLPNGVYFYRLTAGPHRATKKMILMK